MQVLKSKISYTFPCKGAKFSKLKYFYNYNKALCNDEEGVMHSKCDNIEVMINIYDEADEVIKELFYSLKNRYQNN